MNTVEKTTFQDLIDGNACVGPDGGIWYPSGPADVPVVNIFTALVNEVRKDIKAEGERHGWMPIESAPKDGRHIIVCDKWQQVVAVARWTASRSREGWWTRGENSQFIPDYWMPLPKMPGDIQ